MIAVYRQSVCTGCAKTYCCEKSEINHRGKGILPCWSFELVEDILRVIWI